MFVRESENESGLELEIRESSVKLGLRIWSQDLKQVTQVKRRWPGTEPWDSGKGVARVVGGRPADDRELA